ncbi:hypothetical protein [Virgisporangium ochraceum]|uniref:Uncharacterized protein n=1 Tax=Virgisporangium ochraceum TaxID=65505 RepID=A0A8J4ECK8_9ACTN|nr:hypothetical protein [Virgisporangium ochraceum]GIJ69598.1 hypothetical protein Voc01_045150 [Virgisporangium ochraceum]
MSGRRADGVLAMLSVPLAWVVVLFALAAPVALNNHPAPAVAAGAQQRAVAPATGMERPADDDAEGSPGVLGLPPKVHLIVNRTGTGTAPLAPVLAVLPAPVDRTDAGIRIATGRAGTSPADAPPGSSRWGRAPPRASA